MYSDFLSSSCLAQLIFHGRDLISMLCAIPGLTTEDNANGFNTFDHKHLKNLDCKEIMI